MFFSGAGGGGVGGWERGRLGGIERGSDGWGIVWSVAARLRDGRLPIVCAWPPNKSAAAAAAAAAAATHNRHQHKQQLQNLQQKLTFFIINTHTSQTPPTMTNTPTTTTNAPGAAVDRHLDLEPNLLAREGPPVQPRRHVRRKQAPRAVLKGKQPGPLSSVQ